LAIIPEPASLFFALAIFGRNFLALLFYLSFFLFMIVGPWLLSPFLMVVFPGGDQLFLSFFFLVVAKSAPALHVVNYF